MAGQEKFKCKKSLPFRLLSSPLFIVYMRYTLNKLYASAGIPAYPLRATFSQHQQGNCWERAFFLDLARGHTTHHDDLDLPWILKLGLCRLSITLHLMYHPCRKRHITVPRLLPSTICRAFWSARSGLNWIKIFNWIKIE